MDIRLNEFPGFECILNKTARVTATDSSRFGPKIDWSDPETYLGMLRHAEQVCPDSVESLYLDFVLDSGGVWRLR